jgi:hypothetical protein
MADTQAPKIGHIAFADLTVPNAEEVRDFYMQVLGWIAEDLAMSDEQGDYADYMMKDMAGNGVGGVCHARGMNRDLPPQWILYVTVADMDASLERCLALGGKILKQQQNEDGMPFYALIQDPAGAVMALMPAAT